MTFQKATSWGERGIQIQKVIDKCNYIINCLKLPKDDARSLGIIHVRQFCYTIGVIAIKIQQNAEIKNNLPTLMSLIGLLLPSPINTFVSG